MLEPLRFTIRELEIITEALALAASRREAQARSIKHGRHHDDAASEIRRLRAAFMGQQLKQHSLSLTRRAS